MNYPTVLQQSQEDCGAACLASISKYYGRNFTIEHIRELIGTGRTGTTLLGLKQGAESLGFNARIAKAAPDLLDHIDEAPLPAIIHWKGHHWVVLYGRKGNKCVVADPGVGIRYLSKRDLAQGWSDWVVLMLEPDPVHFFGQEEDRVEGFPKFLNRAWSYRGVLTQVLVLNIILGLLSLTSPFLMQILTDDVLVRGDTKLLTTVALGVIVMTLVSSSLELVQSNLIANFAQRLELGLVLEFCVYR
jgi:ATP-binding cassette, subfamily C, bacterial